MELLTNKAEFAIDFLDLPKASSAPNATWEPFQIQFLNNDTRFGIDVKARQIAWSFTAALDAVCDGILTPNTPHVFVSINMTEAAEKIRYAKAIIEGLDEPVRPRLIRDTQMAIEFDNGSRLVSHPCRPPRGMPHARIYLDEMAHYMAGLDRLIYTAALPATIKGDGYIRIGSSPLGAGGLFWEIATEAMRRYPGYDGHRQRIPWWLVNSMCKDIDAAQKNARKLTIEELVHAFGSHALIELYENMFSEDFEQEHCCAWVDESVAWIPWEIIKRNQDKDLLWWHARSVEGALQMAVEVKQAIQEGKIEPVLYGGVDIGRKRDLTEFMAVGKATSGQLPLRLSVSLDRVKYDDQQACLEKLIEMLPFALVLIDQNGIGAQLAEHLTDTTGIAQGVDFTNATKELWAVQGRIQFERGNVPIPVDRDLAYQIHSIKKLVTAAKNNVFDCDRNEKHHSDKWWSLALAVWAAVGGEASLFPFGFA